MTSPHSPSDEKMNIGSDHSPARADEAAKVPSSPQRAEQWTPGPWEASLAADSHEQRSVYGPNHEHVTYVVNGSAIPGRTTANASLIASAPELYEALDRWLALADYSISALGVEPHGEEKVVLELARAALAKARSGDEGK